MIRFIHFFWIIVLVFAISISFAYAQQTTSAFSVKEKCVYINIPVIAGKINNPEAVVLVQYFLRTYEHFPIDVTGVYDFETEKAVREFQLRYSMDILTPWGLVEPTGDVSVTTLHKMNEIYCGEGSFLSLKEEQQMRDIQKKYHVLDNELATTSTTTTFMSNITKDQKGRLAGTPIGFINEVSLPILIMLFVLMSIQTYFMWGFMRRPKMQLFPRKIK